MNVTPDELAGVVDLFGGLSREELGRALAELAYRQGEPYDAERYGPVIDDGIRSYHLVSVGADATDVETELLVAGPVAFPELPPDARDLPHILDSGERDVETGEASDRAAERFRTEAREAIEAGDTGRIETLLDVSYELEAWGDVDLSGIRDRLADEH
ncbi:hypothetical protein BRC65_02780 [Halobacteriales archaeon QH_2_65_14]|nr:MAG: hypothetical protein BRC65_02780 [Halobacteriales archaeon QH_2_65_14]